MDIVATHDSDDGICPCYFFCHFNVIFMSIVKWIIFGDQSDNFHEFSFLNSCIYFLKRLYYKLLDYAKIIFYINTKAEQRGSRYDAGRNQRLSR